MSNYQLIVDGADLSAYFVQDEWSVNQQFGRQGDTATIMLEDYFGSGSPHFHVRPWSSVTLTDTTLGTTLFAGYCDNPKFNSWSSQHAEWQLACIDYTVLASNILVFGTFYNTTIDAIAKALVTQANVGLSTAGIMPAPAVPVVQINYLTLTDALTKLVRLASQTTDYSWDIDYNKVVHLFSLNQTGSPSVTFTDDQAQIPGNNLGFYNTDGFGYEWDGTSLRNSCIVRGTTNKVKYTDTFVANGYTSSFPVSFNVAADVTPSVAVGSVTQTLGVFANGTTLGTPTTQYVLVQNSSGGWFLQTGTSPVPAAGQVIKLSYTAQQPIIAIADSIGSQAAYGVKLQMFISDSSLTNLSTAAQRGRAEMQEYQWAQERVSFTSVEKFTGHVQAGQTITFRSSRIPDAQNGYSLGINSTFLIVKNSYGGVQGNYRTYEVSATRVS